MYYSLTVKFNATRAHQVQEYHYQSFMQYNRSKGLDVVCYAFEHDKMGRLHLHGVCFIPGHVYIRKFLLPGYHIRIDKIKTIADMNRWMKYICKEQLKSKKKELYTVIKQHIEDFHCPLENEDPADNSTDEYLF